MPNPKELAVAAMSRMITAARKFPSGKVPDWMNDADAVIKNDNPDPAQLAKKVQTVMISLCRGEWDRSLVEIGNLAYLDIFRVPIVLLEYCETLNLDPNLRRSIESHLIRERRALEMSKEREQVGAGDTEEGV